jgi:hypothetical protein
VGISERTLDRYKPIVIDGVVAVTDPANGAVTYVPNTRAVEATQVYYRDILGAAGGMFVEDVNWARLRYVTLSYGLPKKWLGGSGVVKGVELSVTGRNLVLFTTTRAQTPRWLPAAPGYEAGAREASTTAEYRLHAASTWPFAPRSKLFFSDFRL